MELLTVNGHLLIELQDERIKFDNGMELRETKGKKDLVRGKVIVGEFESAVYVFYPLYAAIDFVYEGKKYHIIHKEDIVIIKKEK
jgi:co-chaperonin GroES (HSP10)